MKVLIVLAAIIGIALCRPHAGEAAHPSSEIETPIVDDDDSGSSESGTSNQLSLSAGLNDETEDNDIEEKPEIPDVSRLSLEDNKDASSAVPSTVSTATRFDSTPLSQPQQDFTILSSAMYIPPDQPKPAAPLSDAVAPGITTVKKEDGYHYEAPAVSFGGSSVQSVTGQQQDFVAQPAAKTGFTSTSQYTSVSGPSSANTGFTNTAQYNSVSGPSPVRQEQNFVAQTAGNTGFTSTSQYTSVAGPSPVRQEQNFVAQPAVNTGFTNTAQYSRVSNQAATEQVVGNVEIVQQEMRELAPIVEYVMQNYQAQPQQQYQQTQQFQQSQQQPQFYQAAQQQDYLPPHNDYLPPTY